MLVGNKFIFLKIPRTATVAFERSCFLANIPVTYPSLDILTQKKAIIGQEPLRHYHEPVSKLREVFGEKYPIIAIKRDNIDRFISAWKYSILELSKIDKISADKLKAITTPQFIEKWISTIGYSANLSNIVLIEKFIETLIGKTIRYHKNFYMIFSSVMTGASRWHQYDSSIIYYDFRDLRQLELYVRKEIEPSFEFIITNDTRGTKVALEPSDDLHHFYNKWIEPEYKNVNTLL